MKLSELDNNDIGKFVDDNREFLVCIRDPEDRGSGSTVIYYLDGGSDTFVWDYQNPQVIKTGTGRFHIELRIIRDLE